MQGLKQSILARVKRWFPDRQIYFRANGKVHFVHLTPRVQWVGASVTAAFALWILAASAAFLWQPVELLAQHARLREKQNDIDRVTAANARLARQLQTLQQDFTRQTQELELRQKYLNTIIEKQGIRGPAALPTPATRTTPAIGPIPAVLPVTSPPPAAPATKARMPQAAIQDGFVAERLAQVRAAQDRLIAALIHKTESDIDRVSGLVDSTGLSSARFLRILAQEKPAIGQGGPMIPLSRETSRYDAAMTAALQRKADPDDDFSQLVSKARQLAILKAFLATAPIVSPVSGAYVTSPFGERADPIEGGAAFHPGIDLQSKSSQIITATAPGIVTFAGRDGAYGNAVIINHRNGFQTRYAHMSRVAVRVGDAVATGTAIGHMGSTGRSTGLHLHYEIWFNGKLQNPARFLKAADHVFDIRQAATDRQILGG